MIGAPAPTGRRTRGRSRRTLAAAGRSLLYCAGLPPVAVAAVVISLSGRPRVAAGWWRSLRTRVLGVPPARATRRPTTPAATGHALLSLLLGAAALVPLGAVALVVARSLLYPLVDPGPYTRSWGGPTAAGAWLAHLLIGAPFAVAGLAALTGIAAVHERLCRAWDGERTGRWVTPAALAIAALGTVIAVAWLRQLPGQPS